MKKFLSIILAITSVFLIAGCGCAVNEEAPTEATEIVTEPATEAPEAETEAEKAEEEVGEEVEEVPATAPIEEEETLGTTLLGFFKEKANEGMSAEEIANAISTHPSILFNCIAMEVEKGYLPGFGEEITGFTKGFSFAPMIGSIPFVGYIFETEDADALIEKLKANYDLRWNICVEAEEMHVTKMGNKVFFVMCPKNLEE